MKRIFALFLALIMTLSCTIFAGDFNASVKFGTDKNGNTTVTVQDSDLFGMQDVTLTVDCSLSQAYVVYEGKAVESTLLSMVREIVFGVGFALLLPRFFGLDGVLYSMPLSDILTFVIALVLIVTTCRELGSGTVSGISGSSADNAANAADDTADDTADNNADNAANAADNAADNTAGGMPSLVENRLSTAKA